MSAAMRGRLQAMARDAIPPTDASHHPAAPGSSVLPYTHGLTGVNLRVDNELSAALWNGIALLAVGMLVIRVGQSVTAHVRHLLNLSGDDIQQNYWSRNWIPFWPWFKSNVLYAPLWKKRHNREYQLSRAYNVGTLPGRFHTVLLSAYLFANLVACFYLDYSPSNKAKVWAELRGRSGHLSVLNMLPLFLFAGRNNVFIQLLRISFDTFNLFHRWIGRIVIIEGVIHTIAWAVNEHDAWSDASVMHKLNHDPFLQWGLAATIAFSIIFIQACSVIRHAAYETFLHLHQVLAFVALLGIWWHAKLGVLPQFTYVKWIFAIWGVERLLRLARLVYRNIGWRRKTTTVIVEALPADACRVTFDLVRPWKLTPGCHVYAYLPGVSLWMSHPFSIAWYNTRPAPYLSLEDEKLPRTNSDLDDPKEERTVTSISLVMAKRAGMTEKLYNKAKASPSGVITMRGAVEGPYGGLESLHSYGTVFLFAGGVGITHQMSHVRDLLQGYEACTVATRKIILVWSVRFSEQLEWVRPWMEEILKMESRREVLEIIMHITKPRDARETISRSETVRLYPGRPNPKAIIAAGMRDRVGAACVTVCGPGGFADDVRQAARASIYDSTLDFVEESFTW